MPLRPKAAHWFEAKIPRNQTVYALQLLAEHAGLELEEKAHTYSPCVDNEMIRQLLTRIDKICVKHASDLPAASPSPGKIMQQPEILAQHSLEHLQAWVAELLETQRETVLKRQESGRLELLHECLLAMHSQSQDIGALRHSSDFLYKDIYACQSGESYDVTPCDDIYSANYPGRKHDFLLVASNISKQHLLQSAAALLNCKRVDIPAWLPPGHEDQIREVGNRLDRLERERYDLQKRLTALHQDPEIAKTLAEARALRWLLAECIGETPDHSACRLSGWTLADNPEKLEQLLVDADIQGEVFFTPPSDGQSPPVSLGDSRWDRPFRWLVNLFGTPGEKEIDPTPLVSLIVPLLFGFMFPDVGHGLVLIFAGLVLNQRNQQAIILVPCGLSAAAFGFLFGEFFALHDVLPSPLGNIYQHPLEILGATLILGIALILLGLVLSGIEAWWRNEHWRWLLEEAPVLLLYLSVASLIFWPAAWVASLFALGWFIFGASVLCRTRGFVCLAGRLGHLLESMMQLMTASLSFLRVGAFALMHMALSTMVLHLVEQIETTGLQVVVFVVAHLLIIVLEGLIVMIQATRLVALEFFSRFLRFEGRVYKPLQLAD